MGRLRLHSTSYPGKRQSPILTPAERLPGIFWANFFGRPYIEFFGREKLLAAPSTNAHVITDNLLLLLTAESPFEKEVLDSAEVENSVKSYLNQNAFAGPNFPDEPCAVPTFDFSDVRWGEEEEEEEVESTKDKLARLRSDFEAKGYS